MCDKHILLCHPFMLMHIDEKKTTPALNPWHSNHTICLLQYFILFYLLRLWVFYLMLKFFMNISRAFILQIFDMQSINKGAIQSGCANDFRSWYFLFNTLYLSCYFENALKFSLKYQKRKWVTHTQTKTPNRR